MNKASYAIKTIVNETAMDAAPFAATPSADGVWHTLRLAPGDRIL